MKTPQRNIVKGKTKPPMPTIQNPFLARTFAGTAAGFCTESFRALQPACELLAAVDAEATVTINGLVHRLGGTAPDAFRLVAAEARVLVVAFNPLVSERNL